MPSSDTWTRRRVLASIGAAGTVVGGTGLASAAPPETPGETVKIVYQDCDRARIVGSFPREVRAFVHYRGRREDGGGVVTYSWVDGTLPLSVDVDEIEVRSIRPIYDIELMGIHVVEFTDDGRTSLAYETVPDECRGWD